jgi:hypothetical protein
MIYRAAAKLLDGSVLVENSNCALHNMGAQLAPDDSIVKLAEGLHRLYGKEACQRLQQFAAENAKAGDAFSAAYWDSVARIISNAEARQTPSPGHGDFDGGTH